jgi:hypothetical protein
MDDYFFFMFVVGFGCRTSDVFAFLFSEEKSDLNVFLKSKKKTEIK